MTKEDNQNNFIMVYNVFTTLSKEGKPNPYKLNEKELYVFSYLYMNRNFSGYVETTYDALKLFITLRAKRMTENKKEIIKQTESLVEKGIINIIDNGGALRITFNDLRMNGIADGFEKIYFDEYNAFNPRELYMYSAVKRWSRASTGAIYAIWQWGELLELKSDRQIKDILNKACDAKNGFLIKRIGAYSRDKSIVGANGQIYQDANNYFVNEDWSGFNKVGEVS